MLWAITHDMAINQNLNFESNFSWALKQLSNIREVRFVFNIQQDVVEYYKFF